MARRRRFRVPDIPHHVIQRGTDRLPIFRSDYDRDVFKRLLREAISKHHVDVHAYALMSTHYHLLLTPRTVVSLEKAMHVVGLRYASYFNRRYQRTGALFEGRYRAMYIDTEIYWYTCLRYVELNPVRAGIVAEPGASDCTSYAFHAHGVADMLVEPHPLYLALGRTTDERQCCWQRMCAEGLTFDELAKVRAAVHQGVGLGPIVLPESIG